MVLCVGEILLDMISEDHGNGLVFDCHIGGAPLNVAYQIARLGKESYFVGAVGTDAIGRYLRKEVGSLPLVGYDIPSLEDFNTTLAMVTLKQGERDFSFYRKNTADIHLPDVREELLEEADIVHIGSLMLSSDSGMDYALSLIRKAKRKGCFVSFDVNLRQDLYPNEGTAIERSKRIIEESDILKFSKEEEDLFGSDYLCEISETRHVFVTMGKKGSLYLFKKEKVEYPSFPVDVVDTTGAGDAFYGGVLSCIDERKDFSGMKEILRFANACGGLATEKKGAMTGMPTLQETEDFLKARKKD